MKCPFCGFEESKVIDSRPTDEGERIRRRRECISCQKRFTTYEVIESVPVHEEIKLGSEKRDELIDNYIETVRGIECGEVAMDNREIPEEQIVKPLKKVIRIANEVDLKRVEENKKKEKEALKLKMLII